MIVNAGHLRCSLNCSHIMHAPGRGRGERRKEIPPVSSSRGGGGAKCFGHGIFHL